MDTQFRLLSLSTGLVTTCSRRRPSLSRRGFSVSTHSPLVCMPAVCMINLHFGTASCCPRTFSLRSGLELSCLAHASSPSVRLFGTRRLAPRKLFLPTLLVCGFRQRFHTERERVLLCLISGVRARLRNVACTRTHASCQRRSDSCALQNTPRGGGGGGGGGGSCSECFRSFAHLLVMVFVAMQARRSSWNAHAISSVWHPEVC